MLPVFMTLPCKVYFMRASARNIIFLKIDFIARLRLSVFSGEPYFYAFDWRGRKSPV